MRHRLCRQDGRRHRSKVSKVSIIDHRSNALRCGGLLDEQVSHPRSGGGESRKVEPLQLDRNGTRVIKSGLHRKVCVKPLGQRWETLHALRAVKESCCSGHDEVEARVSPGIKLIQQLPKSIQHLLPCISAHALQRLSLIKHNYQSRPTAVAQDDQETGKEMHRAERVQISLYSGRTLHHRRYIWLADQPRDQAFGKRRIIRNQGMLGELRRTLAPCERSPTDAVLSVLR